MPIKQVVCSICNEKVNKAQTLCVGGEKRACRHHSGVDAQAAAVQQKRHEEEQQYIEADRRKKEEFRAERSKGPIDIGPKCFCCTRSGLHQRDYALEVIRCRLQYEKDHNKTLNVFDPQEMAEAHASLKDILCLHLVPYSPSIRLDPNALPIAKLIHFAALCVECCNKQGVKIDTAQPSSEDLFRLGVVYDYLKPEMEKILLD